MMRSRLPVPSLLCLFGTFLMLSPELLLGVPESLSDVPFTDPEVQKALAFAVEKYNQDRLKSTRYFKVLDLLKVQTLLITRDEYRLTMDLVKTKCRKKAGLKMGYKRIQKCKTYTVNPKKANCYFIVRPCTAECEMTLALTDCT